MIEKLKSLGITALVSVVTSGAISGVVTTVMNHYSEVRVQEHTAKIQKVLLFTSGGDSFVATGGEYVAAMGAGRDVSKIGVSLRAEIVKQLNDTEDLMVIFQHSHGQTIEAYETALRQFAKTIPRAQSVTQMGEYLEAFGQALDRRSELKQVLIKGVGVGS